MLHTKFQASKPTSILKKKIFFVFSMYLNGLNLGAPGKETSWILGPSIEQNW